MKRILVFLISALLVICLCAGNVFAEEEGIPAQTFEVRYDLQGIGQPIDPIRIETGRTVEWKPADPQAEGFVFLGWYEDESCQIPWDFANKIIEADTVIYALWTQAEPESPDEPSPDQTEPAPSEENTDAPTDPINNSGTEPPEDLSSEQTADTASDEITDAPTDQAAAPVNEPASGSASDPAAGSDSEMIVQQPSEPASESASGTVNRLNTPAAAEPASGTAAEPAAESAVKPSEDSKTEEIKEENAAQEKEPAEGDTQVQYPAFEQFRVVRGIRITVSAPQGVFPEGARLLADLVSNTVAEDAVSELREEDVNVAKAYTFDIWVADKDGEKIQPTDDQMVSVSFKIEEVADDNLDTSVYHVSEEGETEKLDVEVSPDDPSGKTAFVETDGFSLYIVEFTYESKTYELLGGTSVPLSEIMDKVELRGEPTSVESSNETYFKAVKDNNNVWVVNSYSSFTTPQTLKIKFNNQNENDPPFTVNVTCSDVIDTWDKLQAAVKHSGEIKLERDIICDDPRMKEPLEIPASAEVVIDLNGHKIDRNLQLELSTGNVITVNGTLTIKDTSSDQSGLICGGYSSNLGNGVIVNGAFIFAGGNINGNSKKNTGGSGVYVENGTFTMNGGTISGDEGVSNGNIFTMTGGIISATVGVDMNTDKCEFTLSGGTVSGDTAVNYQTGQMYLSGNPLVQGALSGIDIEKGKTISITGELSNTIPIPVSIPVLSGDDPVTFTSGLAGKGSISNFQCCSDKQMIVSAKDDEAALAPLKQNIPYVDAAGKDMTPKPCAELSNDMPSLLSGWYVVSGEVNITHSLSISGDVNVILSDQAALTFQSDTGNGFLAEPGSSLTIWQQKEGKGKVTNGYGNAISVRGGSVTVNGGKYFGAAGLYLTSGEAALNNGQFAGTGFGVSITGGKFSMTGGYVGGLVINDGKASLSGGKISYDYTAISMEGGAVSVEGSPVIEFNSSLKSGNTGIHAQAGTLSLAGNPKFTNLDDKHPCPDIFLASATRTDHLISISGPLEETAVISILTKESPTAGTPVVFTSGLPGKGSASNFISFDKKYIAALNAQGEAVLAVPVNVSFEANGGSGKMSVQTVPGGVPAVLTANAFARTGYTFTGWNTASGGSGTHYADQAKVTLTSDQTLYAQWKQNEYTIVFENEDGKKLQSTEVKYGTTPAYTGPAPVKAEDEDYTYTFAGWTPAITPVTGDAVYKASFTPNKKIKYTVTEGAGSEYKQGSDGTLTFVFKRSENDEETFSHFTGLKYDGQLLTRDKHYTARSGSVVIELQKDFLKTLKAGDHTLTAVFDDGNSADAAFKVLKSTTYKVTFQANGHGTAPAAQSVIEGQKAKEPAKLTAQGYTFGGWYTEKACVNKFSFDTPITENITLYAKWTASSSGGGTNRSVPGTGDPNNTVLWIILLAAAVAAIGAVVFVVVRKKRMK